MAHLLYDFEQIKESGAVISVACCLSTLGCYSVRPKDLDKFEADLRVSSIIENEIREGA